MDEYVRDMVQSGVAIVGTGLASLAAGGYIPSEWVSLATGAGALAFVAIAEKVWREHRTTIIDEIEDFVEDNTGLDLELDEVVDTVVEAGLEVATDLAEDGVLDTPLSDVGEELVEDIVENLEEMLKDMTINAIREMLSERGLDTDGRKADLIERLLNEA